ncbi:MAG: hypothetical protein LC116_03890 [Bacteroidetes bacterium]|nr:hypothetical protein [Bacteroidota bacterium]
MKRKKVTLQRVSGALCRALDKAETLLDSDLPPDMVLRACSVIATVAGAAIKCHEATEVNDRITEIEATLRALNNGHENPA